MTLIKPTAILRAGVLAALFLLSTACVSNERYEAASTEVENQDEVIRLLREEGEALKSENRRLVNEIELSRVEIERLRGRATTSGDVAQLRGQLASLREKLAAQEELRRRLAADAALTEGVTVRQTPEGTAFSVEGSVLFAFGKADITDKGRAILAQLAAKLVATDRDIRVEGHTDNVPVNRLKTLYPRGNLELSGERALRVADFLMREGGIPRSRISFAGYGAERPVSDNGSDEGRKQNRRVDIVVLNAS